MGTGQLQESSNEENTTLNKPELPVAVSTQSVLTIDTEEHEESNLADIAEITHQARQRSDESTLSQQESFMVARSPQTSRLDILQKFSIPKLGRHKHSPSKASNNSQDGQKDLIEHFERQLNKNLGFLLQAKEDTTFDADLYYQLASVYQKLAKVDVLLNKETQAPNENLEHALHYFKQAINHAERENTKDLAEYHAYRAKCYYSQSKYEEAKTDCLNAMGYNNKNYTAHEIMGYIHKSEGNYDLALASFEQSASDKKHNIHYIVSLYNQSITLAALGRQEEALLKFKFANKISLFKLDMEDQILAAEMHNPQYEALIRELASLSNVQVILNNSRNQSIHAMVKDIEPGLSTSGQIESYSQKLSSLAQELKEERTAHLNDKAQLQSILLKMSESAGDDVAESDKAMIKSDPDLHAFYTEIKRYLNATYRTTQSIGTELVENNKTGNMGDAAKAISFLENFIPVPKAFAIPVKLTSLALEALDKQQQAICIENFNNIAEDEDAMKDLSKSLALKLTLQRKAALDRSEEKSHTNVKDIRKLAIADADNVSEFIREIIFQGKITEDTTESKVSMIIALVNIDQAYTNTHIEALPEHATNSAQNILESMKGMAKHWHSNEDLEKEFVNRLADNIFKANIPESITETSKFAKSLAQSLFHDKTIIEKTHRLSVPWENKYLLKESFLSSEHYFINIISNASKCFNPAQNIVTSDSQYITQEDAMYSYHDDSVMLGHDSSGLNTEHI